MLKISKLADYATVIMHALAQSKSLELLSASELAERTHLPQQTVSKVAKLLQKADLLTSVRGAQGGYQLSRSPENTPVADIVMAIDGQPAMTECSQTVNGCHIQGCCELRGNWQQINKIIFDVLQNVTLADMMRPLQQNEFRPIEFIERVGDGGK